MKLIYAHCRLWVRDAVLWDNPMRFDKAEIPQHVFDSLDKFPNSEILFYTSNPFTPIEKLSGYKNLKAEKHTNKSFDFGMFKTGFTEIYKGEVDDVCIMNDGCYVIDENWHRLANTWPNYDFCGITFNHGYPPPHLQSYFIIFSRKIVADERFKNYWLNEVRYDWDKGTTIHQGECKITEMLVKWGYKFGYFCRFNMNRFQWGDPGCYKSKPPVLKIRQNERYYNYKYKVEE